MVGTLTSLHSVDYCLLFLMLSSTLQVLSDKPKFVTTRPLSVTGLIFKTVLLVKVLLLVRASMLALILLQLRIQIVLSRHSLSLISSAQRCPAGTRKASQCILKCPLLHQASLS